MQELTNIASRTGKDWIREAFQYAASGMAITDLGGHFQETNPAYRGIVGRGPEELDRESILSITHQEDRQNCREQLDRLVSGEMPSFVLEKRYVHLDGSAAWVRSSFSLLKDQKDRPLHIILICNDITEQRRAMRLLVENEKLVVMGQLASTIAHEINNPLEAVLNLLHLARGANSLEEARQFTARAEEEVQRAADIATHTLQFHKQQAKPVSTNLGDLVGSVLVLFKSKLALAKVATQLEKEGDADLTCYPNEIRQVIANLIQNAIQAMPSGGRLRVRVRCATDWRTDSLGIRITVADTGRGMSPGTRKHIYDAFFTTKGTSGTGLGLWVAAQMLAKHGGSMHLRSNEASGSSGTAFTLIFPCDGTESNKRSRQTPRRVRPIDVGQVVQNRKPASAT
jgi:two-component system sporulation sensor kinase C